MKIIKAKTSHPKKATLKISDLSYDKHYEKNNVKLTDGVENIKDTMNNPIEVFQHRLIKAQRYGANGKPYEEKMFTVVKGSQRITQAKKLGFTHIEGIITNKEE